MGPDYFVMMQDPPGSCFFLYVMIRDPAGFCLLIYIMIQTLSGVVYIEDAELSRVLFSQLI